MTAFGVLKTILFIGIAGYLAILLFLYLAQRRLLYFPDVRRIAPVAAGFARAQAQDLRTADGETLIAWYAAPAEGQPLVIYFHGNGGQIADRAQRLARLAEHGAGVLAVSYRGYGGSTGFPHEAGLIDDARTAYASAVASGISSGRIVLLGESLGSGVAVALAAEVKVAGIVLEAPFSSTADVAADIYWMFPVRFLMRDQFRSDQRIARIRAPLLIVHGTADNVVPIRFGERLFTAASEPKTFLRIEGEGHQPMDNPQVMVQVMARVLGWTAARQSETPRK